MSRKPAQKTVSKPDTKPKASSKTTKVSLCPDSHHPHAIDLGLPSGTKWACCNVGANKPEGYGEYYAWGETNHKKDYDKSTYSLYNEANQSFKDIGNSISGTQYDVAHVKWGGSWNMPTDEQTKELKNKCKTSWVTLNGTKGVKIIGPNGRSIFLPASGYPEPGRARYLERGENGYYWVGVLHPKYGKVSAYSMDFDSYYLNCDSWHSRDTGQLVRPVSN